MRRRSWLAFGLLAAWAFSLTAQEPVPQSSFGESIDVRVVNVEAVVTDAKGNRVRGLTAKDFQLLVDGREVPIEFFAEISGAEASPSPSEAAASDPAGLAAPADPRGRNILVFIDDLFSVAGQRDAVLAGLERDLKLLGPEDRMAIVALGMGGRPDVLSSWTGDQGALATALETARKRRAWGNDVLAMRRSIQGEQELARLAEEDGSLSLYRDGAGTFSGARGVSSFWSMSPSGSGVDSRLYSRLLKVPVAVVAAMRTLTPPPGRKVLLLVSGGWPVPRLMVPMMTEANRLGYTAYPVDAQGIDMAITVNDASQSGPSGDTAWVSSQWEHGVHDGLELLARVTGGKALLNSARLDALGRTVEDTSQFYWLGFTPTWKGDDRHHGIRVKVRAKGLTVRSRGGFSDFSQSSEAALAGYSTLLLGGDPKDKRLVVEMGKPAAGKGSTMTVPVTVMIPVADLSTVEQDRRWHVEAVLSLGAMDKYGTYSDYMEIPLRLSLKEAPKPGGLARYKTSVKLRRIDQRLVFTIRDPLAGTVFWGEAEVRP
ncbi:MAG TPA: VWA domain-containing protein [Thermoanaerobaculia bacterium]